MPQPSIPADFPLEQVQGSVAGAQPKLTVRLVDGRYVAGRTDEEHLARYEACEDLAQQLTAYCTRKTGEHPEWSADFILDRTRRGMFSKVGSGEWLLSEAEQDWIMTRVRTILGWP